MRRGRGAKTSAHKKCAESGNEGKRGWRMIHQFRQRCSAEQNKKKTQSTPAGLKTPPLPSPPPTRQQPWPRTWGADRTATCHGKRRSRQKKKGRELCSREQERGKRTWGMGTGTEMQPSHSQPPQIRCMTESRGASEQGASKGRGGAGEIATTSKAEQQHMGGLAAVRTLVHAEVLLA